MTGRPRYRVEDEALLRGEGWFILISLVAADDHHIAKRATAK